MIELSQYGTIIQSYKGNGQLSLKEREPIDCSFEAGQIVDGTIFMICNTPIITSVSDLDEITFVGTTSEGENIAANGSAVQPKYRISIQDEHATDVQLVFKSSGAFHLGLGNNKWQGHAEVHFYITNLNFVGTQSEEIEPNHWSVNHIKLKFDDIGVIIRQLSNFRKRLERIKERQEIDITSKIVLEIGEGEQAKAFDLISVLCDLLSIARGKRINWIYYEVFINGERVYREHQPRIVTTFAGIEVIDDMPAKNTVNFLEECYPHYVNQDEEFKFHSVANVYSAVRSGGFIETRCLAAFSLIEYLAKKASPEKHFLEGAIKRFRVPITDDEIGSYLKIRQSLVHEMKFLPGNPQDQYLEVLHFLDRLLLRILGYDGYYINVTQFPLWSGENKHKLIPR